MHGVYKATLQVWPYSVMGKSAEEMQKICGSRTKIFLITANEFEEAVKQVELIKMGIKTNPNVWMAPIESIVFQEEK